MIRRNASHLVSLRPWIYLDSICNFLVFFIKLPIFYVNSTKSICNFSTERFLLQDLIIIQDFRRSNTQIKAGPALRLVMASLGLIQSGVQKLRLHRGCWAIKCIIFLMLKTVVTEYKNYFSNAYYKGCSFCRSMCQVPSAMLFRTDVYVHS